MRTCKKVKKKEKPQGQYDTTNIDLGKLNDIWDFRR